ncbi:MAG: hypothetical protein ABL998_20820 [Planctomycetota bacterium]
MSHFRSVVAIALLAPVPWLSSARQDTQGGPASEYVGDSPSLSLEVPLDPEFGAVAHLSFMMSKEVVDPVARKICRAASVFSFTTVKDQVQYDFGHISPLLDSAGTAAIETSAGFDQDGKSADYTVYLEPAEGMTWRTVKVAADLNVRVVELK